MSSKTKVAMFEHQRREVPDFVLSAAVVESYNLLGCVVHATKVRLFETSF